MKRTSMAAIVAALVAAGVFAGGISARQMPPDVAFPGSSLTRTQIVEKLTSDTPGTKISSARGKEVYDAACAGCHIFGEIGTAVGPDLTTLSSRFRKADVLDSILWPSKTISDQYAVTVFELTDGTIESGVIIRETGNAVAIKNGDHLDKPLVLALSRVKERTESTVSLMPENLVAAYSLDDIDSLVAFVLGAK